MKKIRCAIYTRKSSEEGLEQDFNSLHAQREACAAYVLSQASEGWSLLPGEYDDGGLSGGTLERPGLQRLLADVEAGKIDIVVVYKVDRLTRSLLDFAKLVEAFDKADTSFVSITQSFNTTTSMGRLTLNMLLSFAQFEREVTAERIRDKIAASKAKGMWMGGNPPIGYRPDGRTLAIVDEHADLIRDLFHRYLAIGNVRLLAQQLDAEGIRVPTRTATTGRTTGGVKFSRGQIYRILSNPTYIGEIHHRDQVYKGRHEAIVDLDLWERVQARLADNSQGQQRAATCRSTSILAGLIVDDAGQPLVASHACKGKVRYRYYISRPLQQATDGNQTGIRMAAPELEKAVTAAIADLFADPLGLAQSIGLKPTPQQMTQLAQNCERTVQSLQQREAETFRELISEIQVGSQTIRLSLNAGAIAARCRVPLQPGPVETIQLRIDAQLKRTGKVVRLVKNDGSAASQAEPHEHLIKLVQRARAMWEELCRDGLSATELADRHGINKSYASRILRINFLAPEIVQAILAGRQPAAIDARALLGLQDLPLSWAAQMLALNVH